MIGPDQITVPFRFGTDRTMVRELGRIIIWSGPWSVDSLGYFIFSGELILVVTYLSDPQYKSSLRDGSPHLALQTQDIDYTTESVVRTVFVLLVFLVNTKFPFEDCF